MKRLIIVIIIVFLSASLLSCNKVPEDPVKKEQQKVLQNKGRLVGDLASASNKQAAKIEGIALLRGLADTGANEPPSTYQGLVLKDLQRDVEKKKNAQKEIASMSTAIVLLEAIIPAGAQKGDRIDVEVKLPPKSEATSIQGGYIENTNLHQYYTADIIRTGDVLGVANGSVVLMPELLSKNSPNALKQGRIIGGAIIQKPRPVWLSLKQGEQTVGVAQRIEDVINSRFSYIKNGSRRKVAEAKAPATRVNLVIPDEYHDNVNRFLNVVLSISFFESPEELKHRITELQAKLLVPETSEFASLQLEAIGPHNPQVIEAIHAGLASTNDMVRFNTAISVAYMNLSKERNEAANILADFVRDNPKLRPGALAVLGTTLKSSFQADARLREFLTFSEPEVRYGAFRALWTRNPKDYMIQGENMNEMFSYHALNCDGQPMIHFSMSKRPELVLFVKDNIFLQGQFDLEISPRISVRSDKSEVIVKKYNLGVDEQRIVSYRLDDIIRALVEVGGSYSDVVCFLNKAKMENILLSYYGQQMSACTVAVDALPSNHEDYRKIRDVTEPEETEKPEKKKVEKVAWWKHANPATWFGSSNKEKDKKEKSDDEFSEDLY